MAAITKQPRSGLAVAATLVCGAAIIVFGVWSLLDPRSFAAFIAFPPYNEHLLHDVGAFQIGLGAGPLLAVVWADALPVTLAGFVVAGTIHTANRQARCRAGVGGRRGRRSNHDHPRSRSLVRWPSPSPPGSGDSQATA